jgi:ketosteroid isomerase-like protein
MTRFSAVFAAIGAFAVIGFVALPAIAHIDSSPEAKALAKLDDDWSAAAGTRDAKRVASFYADDAIAYPPSAPMAVGKAAAEKVWAGAFADPTYNLSWKTSHAEVVGALGYTSGTYEDSYKGPDGKTVRGTGKYLCVWKKQKDGSWKALHDMWNTDAK